MSEKIDLVDANGAVREPSIIRSLVDENRQVFADRGLFVPIAIVVIIDEENRVLWHRRHPKKNFEGNKIDHACGALLAGETPEEGAVREAFEEVGVVPHDLRRVGARVNEYLCYCTLFLGHSSDKPTWDIKKEEVIEADYSSMEELRKMQTNGDGFCKDFFVDLEQVFKAHES